MSYFTETAARHTRAACKMYREARADARRAADFYATAYLMRQTARLPHLPNGGDFERNAAVYIRTADMYLQASFRATDHARFYARLARDYLAMG